MSARQVLYLHSSAEHYGSDRQLLALATGLDRDRFAPVVVLAVDGPLRADLEEAGVETHVAPLAVLRRALFRPVALARLGAGLLADGARLARLIRARRIALVHSNTSVILDGVPATRLAGVPHVVSVREIYSDFARYWPLYRRFLLTADALCCVSEPTRAQFGASGGRTRVVHDAVTTSGRAEREAARRALGLAPEAFVVAVLGRISSWKGQELLVEALAKPGLADRSVIGVLAGGVWPGQEHRLDDLRTLAERLGVAARLRLVGFREDPHELHGAADVIAVPSTRPDPLPNSALEAAASGCCVVAAAHGGLPEIIRDGETGRLFAPGDAGALAAVLSELRRDPAQRARLGQAAAADVSARFSAEGLLGTTQALYESLLSPRP